MASLQLLKSMLKRTVDTKGFNRILNKVQVVSADNGSVVAEMKVEEEHTNYFRTLHGGMTATIVDVFSSLGRASLPDKLKEAVSVNISISYLNPAKIGDELVITTSTVKSGRSLGFLEVTITEKQSGKIIATGSQIEYLFDKPSSIQ